MANTERVCIFIDGGNFHHLGFSMIDPRDRRDDVKPSQSMISYSDIQRILVASDLKPFVKPLGKRLL